MENIVKVFDKYTWLAIFVSLILASLGLLLIANVVKSLGFEQPDNVIMLLMPLSILNAEPMPDCYIFFNKRVYSGSLLLMSWALSSALLTFSFSSNLRAILLAPSYQIPIDTSTQIAENKMSVVLQARENLHLNYFLTSPVPAQVKMMENVVFVNVSTKIEVTQIQLTLEKENYVFMGNKTRDGHGCPLFNNMEVIQDILRNTDAFPERKQVLYFGKELIRPYYYGWVLQQDSKWAKHVNHHILLCQQAGFIRKISRQQFNLEYDEQVSNTAKLNFHHMAAAYILLGIGLVFNRIIIFGPSPEPESLSTPAASSRSLQKQRIQFCYRQLLDVLKIRQYQQLRSSLNPPTETNYTKHHENSKDGKASSSHESCFHADKKFT
ncbi:uncharacterized protein LOC111702653 [Eurytemora carolleeae]|uniref:uncharacterized protein LOC111702653 n=1 Tax=Eurytemora carolleeae TaxID=1294199 RepID=UPI000C78B73F|nr:uncharacterized protein LOC111702653 [Eurytemora carolleeae]|eukprot:XP_023330176.1 uncharacterized protein LOC111702653 [Eurytemora affinis]